MEKQLITNAQMTASSTADIQKLNATSGRLNFNSAWCSANSNEQPPFLQIDLNEIHIITAVSMKKNDLHPCGNRNLMIILTVKHFLKMLFTFVTIVGQKKDS